MGVFFVFMNTGHQWSKIAGTALGTTTLKTNSTILDSIFMPATATGTITIYDSASGTSAVNFTVVNDTVDFPASIPLNIQLRKGLTYVTSGTTNALLIYR